MTLTSTPGRFHAGLPKTHDLLYTKDGTLGIPCVVDTDETFSFFVSVALVKLKRELGNPFFVAYALESPQVVAQVKRLSAGAGLKHMVLKSIRALTIPVPPLGEQEKIAGALRDRIAGASALVRSLERCVSTIELLPPSFLAQAFNGKSDG